MLHGDPERRIQIEDLRRDLMPRKLPPDWYYEPGYTLMREFIHGLRGAGLGPYGE